MTPLRKLGKIIGKDKVKLYAELIRVGNNEDYRVGVGDPNLWLQLGYFMEVVRALANTCVGDNPKGIKTAEDMAEYVSEYITHSMLGVKR